jgi:parvulin-like peptidyl-prolyl isomerase
MRPKHGILPLLAVLAVVGCDTNGTRMSPDALARAGDIELGIEEAARMLAPVEGLPNDAEVTTALADFWVDYALLALVMNENGALDRLDLSPIVRQQENQALVLQLRDEVIRPDEIPDAELEEIYQAERPGERVRARHILLFFPDEATPAQRDSVRELAESLRDRARAGESFATLAERYSDDTGSAAQGGDLNWFARGTMVAPFEQAAFALEPGEVSEVVESQFGLHVIRVEDRELPELDEIREELRMQLEMERTAQAESIFVAGLEGPADITIEDDAYEVMRELARRPESRLSSRAARRSLARYQGGAHTAGDYREFLMGQPAQLRQQIEAATDEQLEGLLRNLTRSELLVGEARRRGLEVDDEEMDAFRAELRAQYRELAEALGLTNITPREGESLEDAVARETRDLMARIVRNEAEVFPLQGLSLPLREHYGARVSPSAAQRTVERVDELRGEGFTGDPPETEPLPDPIPDPPPGENDEETDGEGTEGA